MPVRTTPRAGVATTTTPRTARKPAAAQQVVPTTPGRTAGGAMTSRGTPHRAGAAFAAPGGPRSPAASRRKATPVSSQAGVDALAEAHAAARFWREHANPALTSPDDFRSAAATARPQSSCATRLEEEPTPRTPLREPFRTLSGNHAAPSSPKQQSSVPTPSPMPRDRTAAVNDGWDADLAAELELLRQVPARSGSGGRRDRRSSRSSVRPSSEDEHDRDADDDQTARNHQEELVLFAAANNNNTSGSGATRATVAVDNASFRLEATRSSSAAFMTASASMPASPVDVVAAGHIAHTARHDADQTHITVDMSVAGAAGGCADDAQNDAAAADDAGPSGAFDKDDGEDDVALSAPYGFTPWNGPAPTTAAQSVLSPLATQQDVHVIEAPTPVRDLSSEPISPGPALHVVGASPTTAATTAGAAGSAAAAAGQASPPTPPRSRSSTPEHEELHSSPVPDSTRLNSNEGHPGTPPDVSPVFVFEGAVTPEAAAAAAAAARDSLSPSSAVDASPVFALELTPTPEPTRAEQGTPDSSPTRQTASTSYGAVPRLSWGSATSPLVRGTTSANAAAPIPFNNSDDTTAGTDDEKLPACVVDVAVAGGCCDFSAVEPPAEDTSGVVATAEQPSASTAVDRAADRGACPEAEHDADRRRSGKHSDGGCCIVA